MSRTSLAIGAALALAFVSSAAEAGSKRPGLYFGSSYSKTTIHDKPVHGYSGSGISSFPPGTFVHCDYHRIPIRSCSASGRCKAVAWKLEQFCY